MSENTVTTVGTEIEVADCPLCGEKLHATLVSEVTIPNDKLHDTNALRASVKKEAVALDLYPHSCEKTETRFRARPYQRIRRGIRPLRAAGLED